METTAIRIHPRDTVAVLLQPLAAGAWTTGLQPEVQLLQDVAAGHKIAISPMEEGTPVMKYGQPIGYATQGIQVGEHVHVHNLRTGLSEMLTYQYQPVEASLPPLPPAYFQGYARGNGQVGIRNDIWVIPTVGCVNGIATRLAELARPHVRGSVANVLSFPHPYGCSQMGEDQDATRRILAALACHPNAGGVLLLGLGCENSSIAEIQPYMQGYDPQRVRFLVCQDSGDEMTEGLALLQQLIATAAEDSRQAISCEKLVVGLKCGGSDGLSGITANPIIGGFSDRLVARGGTSILTEVPEMFGAETLLMERCVDRNVFDKTVSLINDFKQYYQDHNQPIYENPSPGNKAGGISTLEDKALGCTQKSGQAPVADVLAYGQRVSTSGLNLLSAPGNDLVAATALAASGAHLVLFSTGRGTPFGSPVPTVKISSNTPLALRKPGWIDFDAGRAVQGISMDTLADELFDKVRAVASGALLLHEEANMYDLAIFKRGVTL